MVSGVGSGDASGDAAENGLPGSLVDSGDDNTGL
jgi:hypothetical protein